MIQMEIEELKSLHRCWNMTNQETLTYWENKLKNMIHTKKILNKHIDARIRIFEKAGKTRERLMQDSDFLAFLNIRNRYIQNMQWPITCIRGIRRYLFLKEVFLLENESEPYKTPLGGGQMTLNL